MNILYPVFALFGLTTGVALRLGYPRYTAVAQRQVDPAFCVVHTFTHLGPNLVLWLFRAFIFSVFGLIALWTILFLGLALR